MKIYDEEIVNCHGGKRRILFATNVKELELVYGIVENAFRHFPDIPATTVEYSRLQNIVRGMRKGLEVLSNGQN